MKTIITKDEIIGTYNQKQQEQCGLYHNYQKIKKDNPSFGYKRISKILKQQYSKTRWWHCSRHIPIPIKTANLLQTRGLLPLNYNNHQLQLISRVLGATFGDGGIFTNLNAIFLSSSELEAVKEFGDDLKKIFGDEIGKNSRIIEGGEYGHSWCYQNTNRKVIRFFVALGAPAGDKSQIKLKVPEWINNSNNGVKDEFFGSIFGAELGVPKVHISKKHLDTLSLGITGKDELAENRIEFLRSIAGYLNEKSIKTGKISINNQKAKNREGELTKIYKLLISTKFENVTNFITLTKMNYCNYKKIKLAGTMNQFSEIKRNKFEELLNRGYNEQTILKLLNLTAATQHIIENFEDYQELYKEENAIIQT